MIKLPQFRTGSYIGAFMTTVSQSMIFLSIANTVMLMATFYNTSSGTLLRWFPWLSFWVFLAIMVAGSAVVLLLTYTVYQPSYMEFFLTQSWKHNNPTRDKLMEMDRDIKAIKKALGITDSTESTGSTD